MIHSNHDCDLSDNNCNKLNHILRTFANVPCKSTHHRTEAKYDKMRIDMEQTKLQLEEMREKNVCKCTKNMI